MSLIVAKMSFVAIEIAQRYFPGICGAEVRTEEDEHDSWQGKPEA
jgi:hypothetical protein